MRNVYVPVSGQDRRIQKTPGRLVRFRSDCRSGGDIGGAHGPV
jgi:hypothetical protein